MEKSAPKNLKRVAFKMKLKPGYAAEYEKRHANIWPELSTLLKAAGVYDYSIFLDEETNTLFAIQKIDGTSGGSQDLGRHPIVKKWWAYMADIMETNADQSPVAIPLREVFYQD